MNVADHEFRRAGSLGDGDQHDVRQADTANRQGQGTNQAQKDLECQGHRIHNFLEFVEYDDLKGLFVVGQEVMRPSQNGTNILDCLFAEEGIGRHPDDILGVFDVLQ